MGAYDVYVKGGFTISPTLTWPQMKCSKFFPSLMVGEGEAGFVLVVDREEEETEQGVLVRMSCSRVAPAREGGTWWSRKSPLEEVEELVSSFSDCEIEGVVYVVGDDAHDVSRVLCKGGKVSEERAVMVWPDGEKVDFSLL